MQPRHSLKHIFFSLKVLPEINPWLLLYNGSIWCSRDDSGMDYASNVMSEFTETT